jgi:hypothetical protein
MKLNFKVLATFILTLFFLNCDHDLLETTAIASKWNATQIIGGFSQPKNYEKGTFTWEFDMNTKTVTIINTAAVFNTLYTPSFMNNQGGVYSFQIIEENNINYLVVENRTGAIKLEQNKLTLDYGIAQDDIAYLFER